MHLYLSTTISIISSLSYVDHFNLRCTNISLFILQLLQVELTPQLGCDAVDEEIKNHACFCLIDWEKLQEGKYPVDIVAHTFGQSDSEYFDLAIEKSVVRTFLKKSHRILPLVHRKHNRNIRSTPIHGATHSLCQLHVRTSPATHLMFTQL